MENLLPILKPFDYRKNDTLYFREKLFNHSLAPVIAFGVDEGMAVMYEKAKDEEDYKKRIEQVKAAAFDNLRKKETSIEMQGQVACVIGNEYSSEKIMDTEFMKALEKKLGGKGVVAGVPFKGVLLAVGADSGYEQKLPVLVKKYFDNPQQDRISDKVFLLRDGKIVAMAGDGVNAERDQVSVDHRSKKWWKFWS